MFLESYVCNFKLKSLQFFSIRFSWMLLLFQPKCLFVNYENESRLVVRLKRQITTSKNIWKERNYRIRKDKRTFGKTLITRLPSRDLAKSVIEEIYRSLLSNQRKWFFDFWFLSDWRFCLSVCLFICLS